MLDPQQQSFIEEAHELLSELEGALLELEEQPRDQEMIGQVFRAMHTIKGSGAMFGFDSVSAFTHEVETVYDLVRSGELGVTKELVDLSLAARDHILSLLDSGLDRSPVNGIKSEELVQAFRKLLPASTSAPLGGGPDAAKTEGDDRGEETTWRIRFRPDQDLFLRGTNPVGLLNELRELGPCRVVAQTEAIPPLEQIVAEHCYSAWDIVLTTVKGIEAIRDVFIFVEDDSDLTIEPVDSCAAVEQGDQGYKKLGEILIDRGDLAPEELERALAGTRRLGERLVEAKVVTPEKIESALAEQNQVQTVRRERSQQENQASIRVPAAKLDSLVDLVGELVTIQSRLTQTSLNLGNSDLLTIAEEVERLTAELRDSTLTMRMLPIGTTFSKFKRLVRDLSQEQGKQIELTTAGAETELDKTVIEKLNDPLVHLIRNSLDHGIEPPQARVEAGKPSQGTVHLSAIHSGDSVVLEIIDDGRGLDAKAIRAKAIERGILTEKEELSEQELFQLIFAPGFSTARKVTSVSGRGVGMDVVKRAIEALRGSIEVDSRAGGGTTIRIKLPLTLAIIESLQVRIGRDDFVLPLAQVEECIELRRREGEPRLVRVRDNLVPYLPLREQFQILGTPPSIEQVVIVRISQSRVGLVVDHVVGEHQTVIKSLGRIYRDAHGISGATILGDGTVALILDPPQLLHSAERANQQNR